MAGGNKNILVGCAGPDTINKSHFLGAVCNMESIMGRIESPVRTLLNEPRTVCWLACRSCIS